VQKLARRSSLEAVSVREKKGGEKRRNDSREEAAWRR
jgi:hypothetical protein